MKKYWFITFLYGASEKESVNGVIDQEPMQWQKDAHKRYPGQYVLQSFQEITEEEYDAAGENMRV